MNTNEQNCFTMMEMMIADMDQAPSLYQPTPFWLMGIEQIVREIKEKGLSDFRSHTSANRFFVPLYSRPYYQCYRNLVDPITTWLDTLPFRNAGTDVAHFLSGRVNAFADYRVFRAADVNSSPLLHDLSESHIGKPAEQFEFDERHYSVSFLNYLRAIVFLKRSVKLTKLSRVLEIGGGFGSLGEILLKADKKTIYIDVDLPPVAAVATYYLKEVFGSENVLGYDSTRDWKQIDLDALPEGCRALVLCPWQLPKLIGNVDLFANFISFQEMEPDVVQNYIRLVQRHDPSYVLLRNLREGKKKKTSPEDIGVNEPILLDDMISWFDRYTETARDTVAFGELKIDNFHSEIVCLVSS